MELVCIGLNHETAPVEVRESLAVPVGQQGELAKELSSMGHIDECVVLSTCNRMEIFLASENAGCGEVTLRDYLGRKYGDDKQPFFYKKNGESVKRHLFRLVSGLDSMVLGETEIFGQVKQAYQQALQAGATRGVLNRLFQKSFTVGKLVRSNTSIQMGQTSVASVAVDLAEKIFGNLANASVLVIGAGETSQQVSRRMVSRGLKNLTITNRSQERAQAIAEELKGDSISFEKIAEKLTTTDIVVSSTSSREAVLKADDILALRRKRKYRPLFLIDLAVPRDIQPEAGKIEEVYLYDMDRLQKLASEAQSLRKEEVKICEQMIEEEL